MTYRERLKKERPEMTEKELDLYQEAFCPFNIFDDVATFKWCPSDCSFCWDAVAADKG